MLSNFWRDLRHAARLLLRQPGFAVPMVLTFALGIGALSVVFSVVYAVLLRPLPYEQPETLVMIWQNDLSEGSEKEGASMPDFIDWRERQRSFSSLIGYRLWEGSLTDSEGTPERLLAGEVSAGFFELLGVDPAFGRRFLPEEDDVGGTNVAILGHDFWRQRFGAATDAIGKTTYLDGVGYEVIGVLPESFVSPTGRGEALWIPLRRQPETDRRGQHDLRVFARLAPEVSIAAAEEEMKAIMAQLAEEYPQDNEGRSAVVVGLYEETVGGIRNTLLLLFAAAVVLLVIGGVNVTNLLLARALRRRREVALRSALGSSGSRLLGQFLAEALFLSLVGGAVGLLFAHWGIRLFLALGPERVPRIEGLGLHAPVLGLALAVTLIAAFVSSLVPALQARKVDLRDTLQDSSGTTAGGRRHLLRRLLVIGEVALAVVLLIGAGLLLRSFQRLLGVELGFEPAGVVTMKVNLPTSRYAFPSFDVYPQWPELEEFYRSYLERARAVPGVESVAIALNHPLSAGWTTGIVVRDRAGGEPQPGDEVEERLRAVSPDYFSVTGTRLLRGRVLTDHDDADGPWVVVVNQAFVDRHYPGEEAIGRQLFFWGKEWEIVGVVEDVRFLGLGEEVPPAVYPPFLQTPMANFTILARTAVTPESVIPELRRAVWSLEPTVAVYDAATLSEVVDSSVSEPRFTMLLLTLFAVVALLLAAVGIYGLMAFSVAQRRTEIGVRMALGGQRGDVVKLVMGEGLRLLMAGVAVGLLLAFAFTRLLSSLLYGVSAADPAVYVGVPILLFLIGLLACLVPMLRATRIHPITALRYQ
jgi:putative ABC transport system permease protein